MAKIYGDTTSDPVEAPAGITGDGTNPVELTNGYTLPSGQTGTIEGTEVVSGTLEVSGILEVSGVSEHKEIKFKDSGEAVINYFATNTLQPNVSGFSGSLTTQVGFTRIGPVVTWTVSGVSGNSDGSGSIIISASATLPSDVFPQSTVNTLISVVDNTDTKIGNAELGTSGDIVIQPFDEAFTATSGQPKSFKSFSITFVRVSDAVDAC